MISEDWAAVEQPSIESPQVSRAPSPVPASAASAMKTHVTPERDEALDELREEIRQLRLAVERINSFNWVAVVAVSAVLVVCVAFAVQSSRQLSHATEVLAWNCERRTQAAPYFPA